MQVKNGTILCVDDEPNILRSLYWMLHKEFTVMTAPDGATALEMLRKHDFDVIVSDQRMPGMIGSELLRHACELAPRAMRILLTGYSDMQGILRSINEGEVFRFVNKPWSNEELSRTVREAAAIARAQPAPARTDAEAASAIANILVLDEDPAIKVIVEQVVAPGIRLCHAGSLSDALTVLDREPIGVVISETRIGRSDTTPLLKLLKQTHPEIVSIVLTETSDVDVVIKLINQGQIYRFVPKPVRPGFLKILLGSAVNKHEELKKTPGLVQRHAVERSPVAMREKLLELVTQEARQTPAARGVADPSLLERIGGTFRRLFASA